MGFENEADQSFGAASPFDEQRVQADIRSHLIHSRCRSDVSDFAQSPDGHRRRLLKRYANANRARSKGMNASPNWPGNRLLLALPSRNLKRLMPELEQIRCQRAQVLMNADSSLDHVFFPDSGVVSVVAVYADGSIIEMATIGREGCSGVQAILGAKRSSVQLLVQIPGSAAKMSRAAFTRAMQSMPSFRSVMDAYVQAFLEQVMVSVACNGAHSLKQRLARWLLMMRDRSDGDALVASENSVQID
jgi:CRP-like cAMP-binding protein